MGPEEIAGLILRHWEPWAAFAYSSFLAKGRGVLRIEIQEVDGFIEPHVNLFYISSDLAEEVGGWPDENIKQFVDDYDPGEEIVIGILHTEFSPSLQAVRVLTPSDAKTPREAFETEADSCSLM